MQKKSQKKLETHLKTLLGFEKKYLYFLNMQFG